jgi:Ca2+-binding EF-hand superfamily protein
MRLTAREALGHPFLKKHSSYTPRQLLIDNLTHHVHTSQLGKFVTALMRTSDLPPAMLKEYRKVFGELRREQGRSKTLTWDRFQIAVSRITKQYFETQDLKKIFDEIDLDNDHQIDIDEFLKFCTFQYYRQQDDRFCNLLIDHLDPERKGYVKVKTFAKLMKSNKTLYQNFDSNFIEEVSKFANSQGHIDYHTLATHLDKNESFLDLEPILKNEKSKHKNTAKRITFDEKIDIAPKDVEKPKSVSNVDDRFTTPLHIQDEKT